MGRSIRFLFTLLLVILVFAGVGYFITKSINAEAVRQYNSNVDRAIETAVRYALYDATRTAEAPISHYRVITLGPNEFLADVAVQYNTTIEVLRMANNLLPTVDTGDGQQIIVPENIQRLDPPRRFLPPYTTVDGDTLDAIAGRYGVTLDILIKDNPILAERGLIPGDIVFIPELL